MENGGWNNLKISLVGAAVDLCRYIKGKAKHSET